MKEQAANKESYLGTKTSSPIIKHKPGILRRYMAQDPGLAFIDQKIIISDAGENAFGVRLVYF